jgi:hypothetical protein
VDRRSSPSTTSEEYYYFRDGAESQRLPNNSHVETKAHTNFENAVKLLFDLIKHPLTDDTFVDSDNNTWKYPEDPNWDPIWTKGLGKRLCIFDMDNRNFNEQGQTFVPGKFMWDSLEQTPSGPFNHYLYGMFFLDALKLAHTR